MRLLLDTHVAIWAVLEDPLLSSDLVALIEDSANDVAVSIAALWEIAIKNSAGRRERMPLTLDQAFEAFTEAGFAILPVGVGHLRALAMLPSLHRDPFDRLLVATALADTWRLVSADRALARYGDVVLPV